MMVYGLWDNVIDDLWAVDGVVFTTTNPNDIAASWLFHEIMEPGRYEIVSGDTYEICEENPHPYVNEEEN